MLRLFQLAKDHLDMARDEIISLAIPESVEPFGSIEHFGNDFLIVNSSSRWNPGRLSFSHGVFEVLFSCTSDELPGKVDSVSWGRIVQSPICVRFPGDRQGEKRISGQILSLLNSPSVDLKNPKTLIEFFKHGNLVVCGIRNTWKKDDVESRKSHHLPAPHPSSMHPRLARWFVNRTGIQKGTLIDPFCGAGGILIEAGLMGLSCEGFDIEQSMINRARLNISRFNLKAILERKDALTIDKKMQFVATDLPYGKATKARDVKGLYQGFLRVLEEHLTERAVIGYPDFADLISMVDLKKVRIAGNYEYYLHKSLTKKIVVIEKIKS